MKIIRILLLFVISSLIFNSLIFAQWKRIKPDGYQIHDIVEFTDSSTMKKMLYFVESPSTFNSELSLSTDYGDSWSSSIISGNAWISSNIMIRKKGKSIYDMLIGTDNGLLRSTDNGLTWINYELGILRGIVQYIGLCDEIKDSIPTIFIDTYIQFGKPGQSGLVPDGMYHLNNKNDTWTKVVYALNDSLIPAVKSSLVINNLDNNYTTILAGTSSYYTDSNVGFIKSTDNGLTWVNSINSYSYCIFEKLMELQSPNDSVKELYGGARNGIFRSTDYGETWFVISGKQFIETGFNPKTLCIVSAKNPSGKIIFAGTPRGTIYYSTNDGESWNLSDNTGIIFTDYLGIERLDVVGDYLIAITHGAWIRPINELITSVQVLNNSFPTNYKLNQNYPNPFNSTTKITYQIPRKSRVLIKVYDILGNDIGTILDEDKSFGNYSVVFDGSNLSSGVYFYKLITNGLVMTKKLILIK